MPYLDPDKKRAYNRRYNKTVGRLIVRKAQARYRLTHRKEINARHLVFAAVKAGRLMKQPCEVCGSTNVEAHHSDYSKPLDVRWFCSLHHKAEHRRQ